MQSWEILKVDCPQRTYTVGLAKVPTEQQQSLELSSEARGGTNFFWSALSWGGLLEECAIQAGAKKRQMEEQV